ncbi:hypothetical protein M011DRAFT_396141 [Sporormia fimetaria CBS 119925]|uniref:Oxidase ustYa n=1 Tax=Sporormia fimetaria CBS 119925 TaxID=1340428 RepID=A0A6A6VPD5_9PLEO|nr:hypothetical protein M011DRAFT_396141 [Sporormia fimetaria CBS 119925]
METQPDDEREKEGFLHSRTSTEGYVPQALCEKCASGKRRSRPLLSYLRILGELILVVLVVFLLASRSKEQEERPLRRTPVPKFPKKIYKFVNDERYSRQDMFFNASTTLQTLHNWIPFSSASRGYIHLPDTVSTSSYDLPEPYIVSLDRYKDGPGYMVSVFHQLHCLSYLGEHFQRGYGGIELDKEVAKHSAHCFNYLRQGIMCAADTTLEGKTEEGPGEGSEHVCTDYDALLEWANGLATLRWREGLLPGESIL